MKEKFKSVYPALILFLILIAIWQIACDYGIVANYLLPSPTSIIAAIFDKANLLLSATQTTIIESVAGLIIGVAIGFIIACALDCSNFLTRAIYPFLSVSQSIPIIAIAPLIVLALGFGLMPKIVLVALMTFFPVAIACLGAFFDIDAGLVEMSKSCGAGRLRTLIFVKVPASAQAFFDALKISVTYAFSAAVIAEWLGGDVGLGVVMTRSRKSFDYETLFACVVIIIVITITFVGIVKLIEAKTMKWRVEDET